MARRYTNKLLEMVEEGILDKDELIRSFCCWLSEDDVRDMMIQYEYVDLNSDECDS